MPSQETKAALLAAAAELIAEVGWNAVSTRAIAQRAGLPHGTVSYHFDGKADLLRQAAVRAMDTAFADDGWLAATRSVDLRSLLSGYGSSVSRDSEDTDRSELTLISECLVQGARDPELHEALLAYLHRYRDTLIERITQDVADGRVRDDLPPSALAALVTAAMDGLMVHAALDSEVDLPAACTALATLLKPTP